MSGASEEKEWVLLAEVSEEGGVERCLVVREPRARLDCALAGASLDPDGLASVCPSLEGAFAEECWFLRAEQTGDAGDCSRAGRYSTQCGLHVLVGETLGLTEGTGAEVEAAVAARAGEFGFADDDRQLWEWVSAHGARQGGALDTAWCDTLSPARRAVCVDSLDAILRRDLEKLASREMLGCDGPLPAGLDAIETVRVKEIAEQLRAEGRCSQNPRASGSGSR